tara:strand:+ start:430 stop:597 length:168 start_codon:yes stop_codon:yes gene_type:complete
MIATFFLGTLGVRGAIMVLGDEDEDDEERRRVKERNNSQIMLSVCGGTGVGTGAD